MPIFEFTCNQCGGASELLVRSPSARPICPHCGSKRLEKQLSTFAMRGGRGTKAKCASCASGHCATCH